MKEWNEERLLELEHLIEKGLTDLEIARRVGSPVRNVSYMVRKYHLRDESRMDDGIQAFANEQELSVRKSDRLMQEALARCGQRFLDVQLRPARGGGGTIPNGDRPTPRWSGT